MRFLSLIVFTVLMTALSQAQTVSDKFIRPLPKPAKAVIDFDNLLSQGENNILAKSLLLYQQRTSNLIVILTLGSLADPETGDQYSIEAAANAYFNTWGIGDKEKNNGVLILVVAPLRQLRIEVGRGLESILTNEQCKQIIEQQMVPYFRERDYSKGLLAATQSIMRVLDSSATSDTAATTSATEQSHATQQPANHKVEGAFPLLAFVLAGITFIGGLLYYLFNKWVGRPGLYTSNGYDTPFPDKLGDDWTKPTYRNSSGSRTYSSGSSSSGSFGGGSSNGGGASGSW